MVRYHGRTQWFWQIWWRQEKILMQLPDNLFSQSLGWWSRECFFVLFVVHWLTFLSSRTLRRNGLRDEIYWTLWKSKIGPMLPPLPWMTTGCTVLGSCWACGRRSGLRWRCCCGQQPVVWRPPVWRSAYHGTWFYMLVNFLLWGRVSPSYKKLGHELNKLGAMVRSQVWHGHLVSQNWFSDGVTCACWSCEWTCANARCGAQWTFPPEAVVIVGVWLCHTSDARKLRLAALQGWHVVHKTYVQNLWLSWLSNYPQERMVIHRVNRDCVAKVAHQPVERL